MTDLPPEAIAPDPPARAPSAVAALRWPEYRWFAAGALISGIGVWAVRTVQLLMILTAAHGSGAAAGALAALQYLPLMVLGGPIGALADRHRKARVLAGGLVFMAASALLEAGLSVRGEIGVPLALLLALLFGIGSAVDNSLRIAVAPELVPHDDIGNAVNLNFVLLQIARLAGPAIAGLGIAWVGAAPVYVLSALTMLAYVAILLRLRAPYAADRRSEDGSVRAGVAYLRTHADLLLVFVVVGVGGLIGPNIGTMAAVAVETAYGGGPAQAGLATSVLASGTLLGAIWSTRHPATDTGRVIRAAIALGVAAMVASLAPALGWYALLLVPAGFLGLVMVSQAGALIQTAVDPAFRGRVTSLFAIVLLVGVPVGAPLYGALTELLGARGAQAVMGALLVACTLAAANVHRRHSARAVSRR